ncbi:MAG: glutamine--tRNA ligase, partial [Quisquiliibacterium sp.]
MSSPTAAPAAPVSNFIRSIVEADLAAAKHQSRHWAGKPGMATDHRAGLPDPAKIRTRFPPEPNGYLHIGHAKSICLNFGLARDYGGACHMRFDDTNPVKEDQEYVDSILEAVQWLGFDWALGAEQNLYYASDYFEWLYQFAQTLVQAGHAYVDSQDADAIRAGRGTLTEPGSNSPFRDRPAAESLALLREMRAGQHAEGAHVLRARIDMASPNMNLRDPVLYRIRFAEHHRTGNAWCIYPMYDFAHPLSDALENITHSICTLEFEDHRPLYDWLLDRLAQAGVFDRPLPQQIEFARLNLTYTITSKRRLQELVQLGLVDGWDDPRMTTIAGLRRRGYTPESIRLFCERIGVSKADSWIDMGVLEQSLRDDLETHAPRAIAVLDPLKLVITNWPDEPVQDCSAPVHPQHPEHLVRLRYGYVIRCTGCEKDAQGNVVTVTAELMPDSRSGTAGADNYKVKGNIHWVSAPHALAAEVRLYDRLFIEPNPDAGGRDPKQALNPDSRRVI